jgi:hypothetical protein
MVRTFISLILSLWAGLAYADQTSITIPESQNDFNARYGTTGQVFFGPAAKLAINPALKSIASNFAGSSCSGIATPVPYQWCVDTTAKTVRLYTPDTGGNYAFHDALSIAANGTVSPVGGGGAGGVTSVAGRSGAVTLTVADIAGALAAASPAFTGTMTGPSATLSGALNAGTATTTGATTAGSFVTAGQARAARLLIANADIVGDSTTDNCTALNAALAAGAVRLPRPSSATAFYRSSCTIIVPEGSSLQGTGVPTSWQSPTNIIGGVEIRCDAAVSPCLQVGATGSLANNSASVRDIQIRRAGATNTTLTNIGILIQGGFQTFLDNVSSDNSGSCIKLKTPPSTGSGIALFLNQIRTSRCKDVHIWNDSFPEVRLMHSRLGNYNDVGSNAYLRTSCTQNNCTGAGTPNGWFITNTQFNSSGGADVVGTLFDFQSADTVNGFDAGDYGWISMSDCHVEVVNHAFQSDATWAQIKAVSLTNNSIVTLQDFFALNAATNLWRWNLTGNNLISFTGFTLTGTPTRPMLQEFIMAGNNIGGNAHITGTTTGLGSSTAMITGVNFENNVTIDGVWGNLTWVGGSVAGSWSDTTTGNVNAFFDRETKLGGIGAVTCAAGVTAGTVTVKNGIVTHC